MPRSDTKDYRHLFLNDVPMMDVRAPVEFLQGAFPASINAPLMVDEERRLVGICYKQRGQDAAIALGHELVQGSIKSARIQQWQAFANAHPNGFLYCFRGGLRSRITQQWLREAGVDYPLVVGGYKALRRFLIDEFDRLVQRAQFVIVSGRTGTGKTRVLATLPTPLDLEGIANHRGSSFGGMISPQPSQIDFENTTAVALMKVMSPASRVFVEDESHLIGRCALPLNLREKMSLSPLMVLEASMDERVTMITEDYVVDRLQQLEAMLPQVDAREALSAHLSDSLSRIRKRLGGEREQAAQGMLTDALQEQFRSGSLAGHGAWIQLLLNEYYDPMYDYQLSKKKGSIVARGTADELRRYAAQSL